MAPGRDCFAALPDALVCRIMCEVGSLHAIAPCRMVCKRWNTLFTAIDTLDFDCDGMMTRCKGEQSQRVPLLESLIGRTIGCSTCGVRELRVSGPEFGAGAVSLWLRALAPSLEILTLEEDGDNYVPIGRKMVEIFRCSLLQDLSLSYYQIDRGPEGVPQLQRLSSLTLHDVAVTDTALEEIVSFCPSLQYLGLSECTGLSSPYICHKAITEIMLSFQEPLPQFILATKPGNESSASVEKISIKSVSKIVVKAPRLGRLVVKSPCELNLQSLGELQTLVLESHEGSKWKLREVITAVSGMSKTNVKSVSIPASLRRIQKVTAMTFFGYMTNCTGLEIGSDLFECLRKCIDGTVPQLPLRNVVVHIAKVDDRSLAVLMQLVSCCSLLEKLAIWISDDSSAWKFADGLLRLQRSMRQVEIYCYQEEEDEKTDEDEEDDDKEEEDDEEDEEDEEEEDDI